MVSIDEIDLQKSEIQVDLIIELHTSQQDFKKYPLLMSAPQVLQSKADFVIVDTMSNFAPGADPFTRKYVAKGTIGVPRGRADTITIRISISLLIRWISHHFRLMFNRFLWLSISLIWL